MKGEDILAIDRFYAVIPAYEPDEKMLAVIDDIFIDRFSYNCLINDAKSSSSAIDRFYAVMLMSLMKNAGCY